MSKYLKKQIEDAAGAIAEAWSAEELVCNVRGKRAHIREGGWKNGQYLADGKPTCARSIIWEEPDVTQLLTTKEYPAGTSVFDIVYEVIAGRMATMDNLPNDSGVNPLKGAIIEEVPEPTNS